jgi:hypothetical protein
MHWPFCMTLIVTLIDCSSSALPAASCSHRLTRSAPSLGNAVAAIRDRRSPSSLLASSPAVHAPKATLHRWPGRQISGPPTARGHRCEPARRRPPRPHSSRQRAEAHAADRKLCAPKLGWRSPGSRALSLRSSVLHAPPERCLPRSTPVQPCYDPPQQRGRRRLDVLAQRKPTGGARTLHANGVGVTAPGCVALGKDQHVLGDCRQEPVAERATVRRRLEVGGRADAVPPCIDEPLRHAVIVPREEQSRMPAFLSSLARERRSPGALAGHQRDGLARHT